jgi:2-(1,2-epoxy-1,2-dihydrophenyl)acetyl-CoA isomerase
MEPSMTELALTHITDGIATLTMNRPEAFNALDGGLMDVFVAGIERCSVDPKVRAIIITGAGKAFCGGGDLKWSMSAPGGAPAALHGLAGQFHLAITEIRRMAKPVIAAVNGVAAGGGFSLALACDFRVLASNAVLKQAYTSAGLSLDGGGTFALPRLVGMARAMEIIAFDAPIPADQALSWGLATKIVPPEQLLTAANDMARTIARGSLHSYGVAKRLMTDSWDTSLETQLERERKGLATCAAHTDGQEGLAAFIGKRKPTFS